jgi:probable rRNA maturation factor
VQVTVTDGRGRPVRDGGLGRWLASVLRPRQTGEIGIALVTDRRIRALNRQYRGRDSVTDVLSFGAEPGDVGRSRAARSPAASAPRFLGDIAIATGVAARQAREAGHAYATELRVLGLHGALHLLGYDHDDPADAGRMARAEARLRRRGGLLEGLIERGRTGVRGGSDRGHTTVRRGSDEGQTPTAATGARTSRAPHRR